MNRATIDFGIDLGTTNSAIAVLKGVSTEIIKNDLEQDITPSAIHYRKNGEMLVGFRAKETIKTPRLDDTAIEFKRRMGSDHIYTFESSGQKRKPEELSAEVLKSLKGDVQQKTGEVIETAVITVPAAFELHQCDATRKAAQLAGFKQSPLLQEPVAAALAFGFQAEQQKAYWLVYDFGGGTFDAAIIKAEEGTIHVINHGGDNFLGGSDIDKALVAKVIAPRVVEEFGLEDFDWAHAGKGGRWRQAFARLKWAAEQAKIELSRKEKVSLDPDTVSNLRDEEAGEIVVEEFEMEISRADLLRVAEPFIARSVEITRGVLKEKKLPSSAIEKVILVGGPTLAPYFRQALADSLRIALDYTVDPFTVVARGAAVFAGTQKLGAGVPIVTTAGEYAIDLKHKPVGLDSTPMVGGRVLGAKSEDFTGFTIELVNDKTQWRSGKSPVQADGVFMINLHAERGDRNTFLIQLCDASGRKRKTNPDHLIYTIGAVADEQPLIHSMGIALANNEFDKFFEKGCGLPQRTTRVYRTVHAIRQGQSGDLIKIPVIEGERELADRNHLIDFLEIKAENIRRDLPVGSEVEITLSIDTSRIIHAKAYVPLLDEEFPATIDLKNKGVKPERLSAERDAEMRRLRGLQEKAGNAGEESAQKMLADVENSLLPEVEDTLAAAKADPDAAAKCEKRLLELKVKLDEAADNLEWPSLVAEARQWLEWLDGIVQQHGTDAHREKAAELSEQTEEIIEGKKMDRLRRKIEQVQRLHDEVLFAQPGFWVYLFGELEKQKSKMRDQTRAIRLLDQGRGCVANNNVNGLRNVVAQLQDLLPRDVVEAAQRGYQSGLIR